MHHKLSTGLDGLREARLEILDVLGVGAAERLEQTVRGRVPREEAVHDGAAEAHLDAGLRVRVQRVVVAVEAVEERGFGRELEFEGCVGFFAGGRVVDGVFLACVR